MCWIPRTTGLDKAKNEIEQHRKTLSNQNNINLIKTPIKSHKAIGIVERLIRKFNVV